MRPADGGNRAWTGGPAFDRDYVWLLSEYDSRWHDRPNGVNFAFYNPDYFLINGKADPHPAGDTSTKVSLKAGQVALIRLINAGYLVQKVTLGGMPFELVASDGRPYDTPEAADEVTLAPGERYDLLVSAASPAKVTATVEYLNWYGQSVRGTAHVPVQFA
ncbi:MAG TPA: hypothetical protein VD902_00550 [Symbiobacteriaceae bacterium]|nr:hypothetical protein [Symbiobacteriaceae bacterium]